MSISEYNEVLARYNAAWRAVCTLRTHVQQADAYLGAYGVVHEASELHFKINPRTHVEPPTWPSADTVFQAVAALKDLGEQLVSAFNHLKKEDRYLVKLPSLHG